MKLIAVFLISCCAGLSVAHKAPVAPAKNQWCSGSVLRGAVNRCQKDYKASQADVDDYIYLRRAANENAKCFRACIFTECKTFNRDGTIKSDVPSLSAYLVSRVDGWKYEIVEKIATKCLDIIPSEGDRCETTEAYINCVVEKTPARLDLVGGI